MGLEGLASREWAASLPLPPNPEKCLGKQSAGVLGSHSSEPRQEAAGPGPALEGSDIQAFSIYTFLDDIDCLSRGCGGFSTRWFQGNKGAF